MSSYNSCVIISCEARRTRGADVWLNFTRFIYRFASSWRFHADGGVACGGDQDNGFRAHEVDRDGKLIGDNRKVDGFEFLALMLPQVEPLGDAGPTQQARSPARYYLDIEVGSQKDRVEIWERSFYEAIGQLERVDFDGIVISVPIEADRRISESQLDSLIRPLRKKYWVDFRRSKLPCIVFDLTKYDALFCQIVAEMLDGSTPDQAVSSFSTPFAFASRREVQELAVRSFCQRWIADNELTLLLNAERQRCSTAFRPRVMMPVSSAWGLLAGSFGPSARQPANCVREGDFKTGSQRPRFPEFGEPERRALTALRRGAPVTAAENLEAQVKKAVERLYSIWRPLGVVEPIPSGLNHSNCRVEMLEFNAGIVCCELPIGLGVVFVAVLFPSGDFFDQGFLVGNAAVEALG